LALIGFIRTADNIAAATKWAFMFYSGIVFLRETRAAAIRRRKRRLRFVELGGRPFVSRAIAGNAALNLQSWFHSPLAGAGAAKCGGGAKCGSMGAAWKSGVTGRGSETSGADRTRGTGASRGARYGRIGVAKVGAERSVGRHCGIGDGRRPAP